LGGFFDWHPERFAGNEVAVSGSHDSQWRLQAARAIHGAFKAPLHASKLWQSADLQTLDRCHLLPNQKSKIKNQDSKIVNPTAALTQSIDDPPSPPGYGGTS
jgi:hypothetical protein